MTKRYSIYARVIAMLLIFILISLCIPLGSVSAIDTPENSEQIEFAGGWNPQEYPTEGKLYKDRIAVNKTIKPTENENFFDINLDVVAKPRLIDQSIDVVVVMDISNTMNSTHEGLGIGDAGYNANNARLAHTQAAVNSFLDMYAVEQKLSADRRFGLVTFNSYAATVVPLTTVNTAEKAAEIKGIVNDIEAPTDNRQRFTNTEGGLQLAKNLLSESDASFKYIIFVTDGFPTTYIESGSDSLTEIIGYDTYMTGRFDASKIGTDGYFADAISKKICTYGVNYSDKAAHRAKDVAESIKESGINVFAIGIDVDVQSISDLIKSAEKSVFTTVDRESENQVIGSTSGSYKTWIKDEIAGGQMIEEAEKTEKIHRYLSGNSSRELTIAFERILDDIRKIPAKTMETAYTLDPMSEYVEFVNFYNLNGEECDAVYNTRTGEDVATFDSETKTITWWLTSTQNYYVDKIGNYVLSVSYRVRLKNEAEGFEFSKAFKTNDTTTLYFKTVDFSTGEPLFGDNHIDYFVPEVEGYVGNFSFTKRDSVTGQPLEGAEFTLEHYGESCHLCAGGAVISPLTATSDEEGLVSFETLPSGHEYALIETKAPQGYEVGAIHSVHIAYGKAYLDGKLITENVPAVIYNSDIIPAKVKLSANKTIEGRAIEDAEFTFVLEGEYLCEFHERMHNDENGKVEFHEIIFDDEGTYNFKVYEKKGKDTSVIYDPTVYEIQFKVTLSDDGKEYLLETKVNGEDIENDAEPLPFEFENTLRKSVSVTLSADKLFDGKEASDGMFNFELNDSNGNLLDTKSTVNGTASFDEITFTEEGVYRYKINESHECTVDEADTAVFFDHNVYDAIVTVTAPDDSDSYKAEVSYYLKDKLVDKAVFENFTRTKATLKINALKSLVGRELKEDEFTFELRKISGKILDKSTNDINGNISFETLEFDKAGYFVFFISEAKGYDSEITYDEVVYKIFVTSEVHHNLSSYYLETTVYENTGTEPVEIAHIHGVDLEITAENGIKFKNTYTPEENEPVSTNPSEPEPTEPVNTAPSETETEASEPIIIAPTAPKVTEPASSAPSETKVTEPAFTEPAKTEPTEAVKPEPTEATNEAVTEATEAKTLPESEAKPKPTVKPENPDVPKTNDVFSPFMWIAVLFVACGIGAVLLKAYKRKEN